MKSVLLIGLGRFGRGVAEKLYELHHQVLAVDKSEERVNEILPLVTDAQIGDATSETFLRSLGVDNFDVCIVTIGEDFQSSLETTSLLKELGARKVVSRASREVHKKFLLRNGADDVVYPEGQLAAWTAIRHTTEHVLDYIALDSEYAIYDLSVPAEWHGKTVGGLDIRRKYNLNILAVRGDGQPSMVVTGDTMLQENQTILVLGKWKDIQKCFRI
ncbi:potassium channel family protein [Aristaeella hokkaidonensis]|uniref:TrkA family potassium uptake protein n=1 Tax=Aristaeella hokkaidonensis TaxID=3046382 RepID=A0AC61MXI3_9FIRM|nr:TrkA family potassium uptake protein [Aristaeella hokkaidonensis]QUC67507.1 TrkA family potassium uptake protein [Aristaeella hokkaidonensis]SNT92546.1 trk system potassium uptake protein TrkA [Aristaeella hokkaidonensis]